MYGNHSRTRKIAMALPSNKLSFLDVKTLTQALAFTQAVMTLTSLSLSSSTISLRITMATRKRITITVIWTSQSLTLLLSRQLRPRWLSLQGSEWGEIWLTILSGLVSAKSRGKRSRPRLFRHSAASLANSRESITHLVRYLKLTESN